MIHRSRKSISIIIQKHHQKVSARCNIPAISSTTSSNTVPSEIEATLRCPDVFSARPSRLIAAEMASSASNSQMSGQRHERDHIRPTQDDETSVTQKMLSAVSGSVLTSLLGIIKPHQNVFQFPLILTISLHSNSPRRRPRPAPSATSPSVSLARPSLFCATSTQSRGLSLLSRGVLGAESIPVLRCFSLFCLCHSRVFCCAFHGV